MGLALPLAMLGLALAGVPVLAHLLRQSDVPTRILPTVALLARAIAASRRRVRVVDPWLLAVRIALVSTLALAVAAPFTEHEVAFGTGGLASVAIVIDDSMSMARVEGPGSAFDGARARALDAVNALPDGSEVALILAGSPPRVAVPRTTDRAAVAAALEDLAPPGARGTAVDAAVELGGRQLAGALHSDRRVLLLSDLAGTEVEAMPLPPSGMALTVEPIGGDAPANVAIASVDATDDPTLAGSLSVAVTVRSFDSSAESGTLSIVHDGRVLTSAEVALVGGGGRATLRLLAPDDGDPRVEVRITTDGDSLPLDDARGLLLRPPAATRVLLVDGNAEPLSRRTVGSGGASTRYVAQALALAPPTLGSVIAHGMDVDAFVGADDLADVVVLADVDVDRADVAVRVRALARGGAGILVAGGDRVRPGATALADLLPARITAVATSPRHGLRAGAAALPSSGQGLEAVETVRALVLDASDSDQIALRFEDGSPALILDRARRTALLALAVDDTTSDLPFHPGFVPLMLELTHALARPGSLPDVPFSPAVAPILTPGPGTTRVDVVRPDGSLVTFEGDTGGSPIALAQFDAPGAYRVRVTDSDGTREEARSAFVVAPPIEESNLRRSLSTQALAAAEAPRAAAHIRTSLAPWLFALAGVLAVIEGFARRGRR